MVCSAILCGQIMIELALGVYRRVMKAFASCQTNINVITATVRIILGFAMHACKPKHTDRPAQDCYCSMPSTIATDASYVGNKT